MRLFVALDLPDAVCDALPAPGPPWRAVPRANLHVTLVFIGNAEVAPELTEPPPRAPLRLTSALVLPPRRPRVLAVGLEDPTGAYTAFQAGLARELDRVEDRPWLPHITVGRTRERVRRDCELPPVEPIVFTPPCMTLYRTAGGRYEPLARVTP